MTTRTSFLSSDVGTTLNESPSGRTTPGKYAGRSAGAYAPTLSSGESLILFLIAHPEIPTRFWRRVQETGTCWLWQGSINQWGYGVSIIGGVRKVVHRWTYEAEHGPVPDGHELDHLCRNRRCVRPSHHSEADALAAFLEAEVALLAEGREA